MERWHRTESTESGWISLADLLILLFAIAMVMGIGALSIASRERSKAQDANDRMEVAESRVSELAAQELMFEQIRGDLGDWQFVAREVEGRWRGERDIALGSASTPAEFAEFLEGLHDSLGEELRSLGEQADRLRDEAFIELGELRAALSPSVTETGSLREFAAAAASEVQAMQLAVEQGERALAEEKAARLVLESRLPAGAELLDSAEVRDLASAVTRLRELEAELLKESLARAEAEAASRASAAEAAAAKRSIEQATSLAREAERQAASSAAELGALTARLHEDVADANRQLQEMEKVQRGINQQLLGITGSLEDVVFVIDRSQSMSKDGRWDDAKRTIRAWIEHLPVERAAMVVFGSSVTAIPDSTALVPIEGLLRREFASQLDQIDPAGSTLTLKAMQRAMRFESPDAIILFTDGNPERASGDRSPADQREAIYRLVDDYHANNPETRVHTVGIGDYFNPRMSEFLVSLAQRTGGTFIGR